MALPFENLSIFMSIVHKTTPLQSARRELWTMAYSREKQIDLQEAHTTHMHGNFFVRKMVNATTSDAFYASPVGSRMPALWTAVWYNKIIQAIFDIDTQMLNQQYQEPFVAIVIDPTRTISAGKVNIGAFRTYPKVRIELLMSLREFWKCLWKIHLAEITRVAKCI